MATADGSILIRTEFDKKDLSKGMSGITKSLQKISSLAKITLGVGFLAMGKQAISLASDLQEVQNVVDVAFGDMAYKIEEFADTSIEQFGLSELSAKQMASTFMAMANGMGQGLDLASDKSVELTGRLADIMSFYNKSISEVETIGRAVYSGETEPLKAIGVIMTEAQLQTFALAQGYQQLYKDMSSADKLLIRQEYFLSTTAQAAGDFARTQNSWANQVRILTENWKQFLSVIGSGLINVLAPLVSALNTAVQAATKLASAIAQVLGLQSTTKATTSGIATNIGGAVSAQEDLTDATNTTNKAAKRQLAFFDDLNVLAKDTSASTPSISGGGAGISTGITGVTNETDVSKMSELAEKIKPLVESISNLFGAVKKFTGNAVKGFLDFFKEKFDFVTIESVSGALDVLSESIKKITPEQAQKFGSAIGEIVFALGILKAAGKGFAIITTIGATLKKIATYLPVVLQVASSVNPATWPAISDWLYQRSEAYSGFVDFLNGFFENNVITSAINDFLGEFAVMLKDAFLTIFDFGEIFNFEWTKNMFEQAGLSFDAATEAFKSKDWVSVGLYIVDGIFEGLAGAVTFLLEPIIKFVDGVVNTVINGVNFMIKQLNKLPGVKLDFLPLSNLTSTLEWESLQSGMMAGTVLPKTQPFNQVGSFGNQTYGRQDEINKEIKLILDGKELAKATSPYLLKELARQGFDLAPIGGTK